MNLHKQLSRFWLGIQDSLFPWLKEELGELTAKQQRLVAVLEMLQVESHIHRYWPGPGRPLKDRAAIARAFVAKSVYNLPTTRVLIDRLHSDIKLRRICGWEKRGDIPSESVFSRAFKEFAQNKLPQKVHEYLVKQTHRDRLVGHISRDSTKIEAREKPLKKEKKPKVKGKRGRPKKGEEQPKEKPRLQRQQEMTLKDMLEELPKECAVGTKKNSKGYKESWIGYKLHLDVADGDIPLSCILTSASVHDSQVALPLSYLSSAVAVNLYDLMDSAYDAEEIYSCSRQLGHIPIIDKNPRGNKELKEELETESLRRLRINFSYADQVRYRERSSVERVNGNLKDNFGGRQIRVRGPSKIFCHLMFAIAALTAEQLLRLVV